MSETTRPRPGQPTKYKPEFCEEIVAFCGEGYSLAGFAGSIGVSRDSITEWAKVHPEFSAAVRAAKAAAAYALEKDACRVRREGGAPGAATIIIFGLKNFAPEDWTDKQQFEHSGPDGGPIAARIERVIIRAPNPDG